MSALGVGFLPGAVLGRPLAGRVWPRHLLAASQFVTTVAFLVLFGSMSRCPPRR
ncbi:hypothetical protein [Lentzea sp. NPDC055074]